MNNQNNPLSLSDSAWNALRERYGAGIYTLLDSCPYELAVNQDIEFAVADDYVMVNAGIDPLCPARIANALMYTLKAVETGVRPKKDSLYAQQINSVSGSTCIPKSGTYTLLEDLLDLPEGTITMPMLDKAVKSLVVAGRISVNRIGDQIFLATKESFTAERESADRIRRLLSERGLVKADRKSQLRMYCAVDSAMAKTGKILSQEQKNAVCMVLQSHISVLTGGPGTGKSMTQKILVESFRILKPGATIRCIAPTGQAASRMREATGCRATTIHSALGLVPGEDARKANRISDDLILVDESSMIDIFVLSTLLKSISDTSTVVFIGDTAQLPSVSAGNILDGLIRSRVPVSELTKVFRQKDNSIAFNCAKIKSGNTSLEEDASFRFIECSSSEDIRKKVCELYSEAVRNYGIDSVCCLTPFRHRTKTGVNSLNRAIRSALHDTSALTYCERDGIRIYTGDRIVFLKNRKGFVNGETGTAVKCWKGTCVCRFGEKELTLKGDDLLCIEPAFAQTVHKAQGQEYRICIIVCDKVHKRFLNRNLIYTSVSRAVEKCICLGSLDTLKEVIASEANNERFGSLAGLIGQN